jgi:Family of unknown function (DUF6390)
MTSGPALFCRFAFPPNLLGYCGPEETGLLSEIIPAGDVALDDLRHVAPAFTGAWPYLELIAGATGRDPLDAEVVEAYWLGSELLERVDLLDMGNSIDDRFRRRAGSDWAVISGALNAGARPTHSFHVFCVYPWVGLLRSGAVEPSLRVLDRCRIRWGTVTATTGDALIVRSRPLTWDGWQLGLGSDVVEAVHPPVDGLEFAAGDRVAMHWGHACSLLTDEQVRLLERYQARHLRIANLAGMLTPAGRELSV